MRCHKYSRSFGSIDRVDRWAVWRVLASLLPQTTLPQASPAAQLELDTRARRLRARGVAGNAILGAFRCRSPPSHPTFTPDNPLQTAPFLIARYDDARAKPTHARALRRRRRSLARSRARCVAVAVEVAGGYIARHARYARRASRAYTRTSSPRIARVIAVFRPPRARPARARCSGGGARSLPRLRARGVAVVMVMAVAVGHAARHTHHALRASRARTCASSTGDTRVITVPFPPRARTPTLQRKRRSLAPSIARARCGGKRHPGCLSVPLPPKSPDSPPLTIPSKPSRSSSPGTTMLGQSPLTRVHCGGGGARSLARSRARCVAVAVEVAGGYIARHARYARRASRACMRTSSPRIARVITAPLPRCHPCARAAAAAALSRLLACSRARRRRRWGWGRRSVTSRVTRVKHVTRVARHARARAYHHRFARVITVFRPPRARPARARCCGGGARSLARSRARGVALAVEVAFSYTARHARHAQSRAARARHHRASRASSPFLFPPCAHTRALRRRRRSLAR